MKVLVTGVAGFLGSHIADRLIANGHDVCGIDNLLTGREENVHEDVNFHVDHVARIGELFDPCEVIVHCAASYDDPENWWRDTETNTLGTIEVCELARNAGARVVYLQTALCYGHQPDMSKGPIRLGTPIAPDNSYAISKTAGESYLIHSGLDYVSLRLANIYGPRNLSGPIPTFYKRLSEGKQCKVSDSRRDFVHVNDFLRVAIPAIEGKGSGVYHVSTGRDYPIIEVYNDVATLVHGDDSAYWPIVPVPRQDGDAASILLDPLRTNLEFGWTPKVTLGEGIKSAVSWYSEHGVDRTFTHLRQD